MICGSTMTLHRMKYSMFLQPQIKLFILGNFFTMECFIHLKWSVTLFHITQWYKYCSFQLNYFTSSKCRMLQFLMWNKFYSKVILSKILTFQMWEKFTTYNTITLEFLLNREISRTWLGDKIYFSANIC